MKIETERVYKLVKKYGVVLTDDMNFMDDVDKLLETVHKSDYTKCLAIVIDELKAISFEGVNDFTEKIKL